MIFVAVGHAQPFDRLVGHMDRLSLKLDEPVVQQVGRSAGPVHCEGFDYAASLGPYYDQARLVVVHAGVGITLELLKMNKPIILVPRQQKFGEHFDDHQIETAEKFNATCGLEYILDIEDLTIDMLKNYSYIAAYKEDSLRMFRENIGLILHA
ncbi:MAG: beta-1,4-galactosyltransferase [Planctomycetota bacterium]|nr:MAG: beta-1,4-galactosyltransferase [Planctomycetota bacterium]